MTFIMKFYKSKNVLGFYINKGMRSKTRMSSFSIILEYWTEMVTHINH